MTFAIFGETRNSVAERQELSQKHPPQDGPRAYPFLLHTLNWLGGRRPPEPYNQGMYDDLLRCPAVGFGGGASNTSTASI